MARRNRKKKKKNAPPNAASKVMDSQAKQLPTQHSKSQASWVLLGLIVVVIGLGYAIYDGEESPSVDSGIQKQEAPQPFVVEADLKPEDLNTRLNNASTVNLKQRAQQQLDPSQDGWDTEVIAEQAKVQLKHLAARLTGTDLPQSTMEEISPQVACGTLRPQQLVDAYRNGNSGESIVVKKPSGFDSQPKFQGRSELVRVLDELAEPFSTGRKLHTKVKVIRVSSTEDSAETAAFYEADCQTANGGLQQRATWNCRWQRKPDGKLLLTSITSEDFEEVHTRGAWLVDCTKSALGTNNSFHKQLSFGLNHWLLRLGRVKGMHVYTRNGLSLGDVNGDGRDDVYVCQPGGLPNLLYIQQPDGTLVDRSRAAGVDWLDKTTSSLLLDLDNDGDQDLVAATVSGLLIMSNDGTGKYQLKRTLATNDIDTQSISAADYDNDGDLDLFVCFEFARKSTLQHQSDVSFVYHNANDGAANVLYRNDISAENWQFSNATEETGLDTNNRRHSLACAWEDFDNDGDQDLYVANDYGHNCLYRNTNGRFEEIAERANALDTASGMSVSWGDYDHDGWMDLYVANMFSSAGNRIARQEQFKSGNESMQDVYLRFAKGNTLLRNANADKFEDVGSSANVEMGRWAWSSVFSDLNNDSWDDLLVANGYISTDDTGDL